MSNLDPTEQFGPTASLGPLESEISRAYVERNFEIENWKIIAESAGFPIGSLHPAETEILDMVDRVVIHGMGWGKKDKLRNVRDRIPISPKRLSGHGKKLNLRTYQRALKRLLDLGLLKHQATNSDQVRVFSPAWWIEKSSAEAQNVWRQAAFIHTHSNSEAIHCRSNVIPMTPVCHTHDAPPDTGESSSTHSSGNKLHTKRCDKSSNGD